MLKGPTATAPSATSGGSPEKKARCDPAPRNLRTRVKSQSNQAPHRVQFCVLAGKPARPCTITLLYAERCSWKTTNGQKLTIRQQIIWGFCQSRGLRSKIHRHQSKWGSLSSGGRCDEQPDLRGFGGVWQGTLGSRQGLGGIGRRLFRLCRWRQ